MCQQFWNVPVQETAAMFGYSSIERFLRPPRENWAVQSSLEPWSSGTNWVWSHTTDSSPTRTRCQREALATWSLCLCKRSLVQRETVFLSIRNSVRTKISGHFWQASKECRLTLSRQSSGKLKNEKNGLPSAMLNRLLRLAAFQNPEFYKAQAMRLPTFNKPRVIACGEDLANHIALPRGCLAEVMELFEAHYIKPDIRDERCAGHSIDVEFCGQLRPSQQDAVSMIAEHDEGKLCAPTAFGKTAVAAWLIAARKVNTLVLVHRQQLLDQWHARLAMFLNLPAKSIGQVGGGKSERCGTVDIAIIQSTHGNEGVKDFVAEYGQVIVDECHHLSAFTFEQV